MDDLFSINIVLISTIFVGLLNLLTPFVSLQDTKYRSFLMISVGIFFLANVILIDTLFLEGIETEITIFALDKFSIAFNLEAIGLIFLTMLAVLWIPAMMYTIKFLTVNEIQSSSRFLLFVNAAVLSGVFIALSANLFTMFVFYEILTLCTIPLIAHKGGDIVRAGLMRYLKILMIAGVTLFLPAVILVYSGVGHGNFELGGILAGTYDDWIAIFLLLMFIFGITKAAIFPLHFWLPSAMVASYPVSAMLHAVVVVKTGLFCIYKVLVYTFGLSYLQYLFADYNWLVFFPILTIIYSSLQALRFSEIKMVLAYSTINQLSIAILSAFLLSPRGIAAAIMHMVAHSFTKICLFYSAGNIYSVKNAYKVGELIGIRSTMPLTSLILLISGMSLMGIPPFAGFISKFYIMLAAAEQENILVMVVLAISTIFSAIYMIKMLVFVYRPTTDEFILNLKLKPFFAEDIDDTKHKKQAVNYKHKAEQKLPAMMMISLFLCLLGVLSFVFIQQIINKFLEFI